MHWKSEFGQDAYAQTKLTPSVTENSIGEMVIQKVVALEIVWSTPALE
jgi:hypothetical protein